MHGKGWGKGLVIVKSMEQVGSWGIWRQVGWKKRAGGKELVGKRNFLQLCGAVGPGWRKSHSPGLQSWCSAGSLGKNSSSILWFSWKLCGVCSGRCGLLHMVVCRKSLIALNLAEVPNPPVLWVAWFLQWSKQERHPSTLWAHYVPVHHQFLKNCHRFPRISFGFIFFFLIHVNSFMVLGQMSLITWKFTFKILPIYHAVSLPRKSQCSHC